MTHCYISNIVNYKLAASIGLLLILHTVIQAQPAYIYPASNPTYTGGVNSWPLNASVTSGHNTCQWLYLKGDFIPALPAAADIHIIYVKPSVAKSFTFNNLVLKMVNTSLTTLTNGPWVSPVPIIFAPTSYSMTTIQDTWFAIVLPTAFHYTGGGILLELSNQGPTVSGITLNQFNQPGRVSRIYGISTNATSSGADSYTACLGFDLTPTAVNSISHLNYLSVFPNPSNGPINIAFESKEAVNAATITITDITGHVVLNQNYSNIGTHFNENIHLPASSATGMYFVTVLADGERQVRKLYFL